MIETKLERTHYNKHVNGDVIRKHLKETLNGTRIKEYQHGFFKGTLE